MIYPNGLLESALKLRSSRLLAVFLSVALIVVSTLFVPSMVMARQDDAPPPVVLVFPFTDSSTLNPAAQGGTGTVDAVSKALTDNVRLKIDALGYYRSTLYSKLHPSIQRAVNVENTLGEAEADDPTATPDRAQKIAVIVSAPFYLAGNIDQVTTDTTAQTSSVVIDGGLYNTNTGAVVEKTQVTGTSSPGAIDPQASALDNASGKLVAAIVGPQFTTKTPTSRIGSPKAGINIGTILLAGLAIALALVIINNHTHTNGTSTNSTSGGNTSTGGSAPGGGGSGGGGNTGSGTPPPPPI
jgi:uncharacterized membrane protein YgcG